MTAADVRASLALKWPDSEYLSIEEAPESSDRGGRKIDLLVISLWKSRGLQLDAVEIKVSMSDWTRELKEAAKADFWWRHAHRFWIAAPEELAARIRSESLPTGWGLLSCRPGKPPKVLERPPAHIPEPLAWPVCVGLMRAAANCGIGALQRAENRGVDIGFECGLKEAERKSGDVFVREQLDALREKVRKFEAASGISIEREWELENVGQLVALIRRERSDPGSVLRVIGHTAKHLIDNAETIAAQGKRMQAGLEQVSAAIAAPPAHTNGSAK